VLTERLPAHVLLVEDDPGLATMVSDALRERGYTVWHVDRGSEAEAAVEQLRPDVIVLDLILPDRNGLVLCANLKRRAGVPVIICSATKRKDDALISLHLGADDFLPKPFSLDELQARIDIALRRGPGLGSTEPVRNDRVEHVGNLTIDKTRCWVTIGSEVIQLTPTEYRLLCALAGRATEVVGRQELAERVWGSVDKGVMHSLDVHMRRLRAKLTAAAVVPGPRLVTRRGFGYQLVDERRPAPSTEC
jgi:DNA-binding response OmpR family regulator